MNFTKPGNSPVNTLPSATPSWCQFSWCLQGERREVQCRLPYGHGGTFHRCGVFVTATTSGSQKLPDWLPSHIVAARPRPVWLDDHICPVWLDDHICPVCGYDTGSYGHYTQCR